MTTPMLTISRQQMWPFAQKYFDSLPIPLFRQTMLLMHNLGLQASDTTHFQDILARPYDYPLLDQPFWLFNDLQTQPHIGGDLLQAILLQFLANELEQNMQDELSFITSAYKPLQQTFQRDALAAWRRIFSPSSPFWQYHPAEAQLLNKWELGRCSLAAVAIYSNYETHLPHLLTMSEHLGAIFQVLDHTSTLLVDVKYRRPNPLIQRALTAVHAETKTEVTYEFFMGAWVLTGTLKKVMQECSQHLEAAHQVASQLNLPTFQKHTETIKTVLHNIQGMFSLQKQPHEGPIKTFFLPAPDLLPAVLAKAEACLLAEQTFCEAWEVQRSISQKIPNLTGQAFPSALILEILCKHGLNLTQQIDQILNLYIHNGFRYYNQPEVTPPDADDLAFAMRLSAYSTQTKKIREHIKTPLRWMRENQYSDGQIPVWFTQNDSPISLNPYSVLYGGACATVEANLMLGMIHYDWQTLQGEIETCAHSWCDRWLNIGLSATSHYPPLFSLWVSLELVTTLSKQAITANLKQKLDALSTDLLTRLSREAFRSDLTPQDASFLTLACFCASDSRLPFNPNWLTLLLKHQRHDGFWDAEPIYIVPTGRGLSTVWHTSRTITTAFCYHALKTYCTRIETR